MACAPESNQTKYEFYRGAIEKGLARPERLNRSPVTEYAGQMGIVTGWEHRYLLRYVAVECNSTYGTQIADRPAAAILTARHRERDSYFPEVPNWSENLIFYVNVARMSGPGAMQDWNGHPPLLETPHAYGPSLRELWAKAKEAGADEQAAWEAIRDWILYRPPSWDRDDLRTKASKPPYEGALSQRLDTDVAWTSTGDFNFPWSAEPLTPRGTEHWRVRVNDFPDEYMYSLVVGKDAGEEVIGDFHDWPVAWTRPEGPGWLDPKAPAKLAVFAAPKDIAPERLLDRYIHGEHITVWNDLIRLGPAVRQKPYREPAEDVCREIVRRSRENLVSLIGRLRAMEFEFWSMKAKKLIRLTPEEAKEPWTQAAVWEPPKKDTAAKLARLERKGIVIPLVLRIWAEEIGQISLLGSHPRLCPFYTESLSDDPRFADPLMVSQILPLLSHSLDELDGSTEPVLISYDDVLKAEIAMDTGSDDEYSTEYPNAAADANIEGLWYEATFVGYVRKSFQWGGFPGWERYSDRPEEELALLRGGLLPI
jgi:hypothetical protein